MSDVCLVSLRFLEKYQQNLQVTPAQGERVVLQIRLSCKGKFCFTAGDEGLYMRGFSKTMFSKPKDSPCSEARKGGCESSA